MKKALLALVAIISSATICIASPAHDDKTAKEDIARHRAIAAAHEAAAKCLESGKKKRSATRNYWRPARGLP